MGIVEVYDYYMTTNADPRTNNWFLVSSPIPILTILSCYLYFVTSYGERFMKDREPYSFKTFMTAYNVFQIVANLAIVYYGLTSGWTTTLSLGCEPLDYSWDPMPYRMAKVMSYLLLIKLVDLIETVIFVLRKKSSQVSFLHVYHHVSTLLITWLGVKYVPGGMATFSPILNSFIHVIMYSYYLLRSIEYPSMQQLARLIKRYITIIQMCRTCPRNRKMNLSTKHVLGLMFLLCSVVAAVLHYTCSNNCIHKKIQFIIILAHTMQSLLPSCPVPRLPGTIQFVNVLINFWFFYNFYKKSYTRSRKQSN